MTHALYRIEFRYNDSDEWMTDCCFKTMEDAMSYLELMHEQYNVMTKTYISHRLAIGF